MTPIHDKKITLGINHMKKILFIFALLLTLSACVHKVDIQQGNLFTPDMVSRLHPGMTMAQVKNVMGTPVLMNTFNGNRVDYVYTYKPGWGATTEKYVTLVFRKGRLHMIDRSE